MSVFCLHIHEERLYVIYIIDTYIRFIDEHYYNNAKINEKK